MVLGSLIKPAHWNDSYCIQWHTSILWRYLISEVLRNHLNFWRKKIFEISVFPVNCRFYLEVFYKKVLAAKNLKQIIVEIRLFPLAAKSIILFFPAKVSVSLWWTLIKFLYWSCVSLSRVATEKRWIKGNF